MKIKYLFILIILFAFACQNKPQENTQESEVATETTEQIVMENASKVEINIEGMTCTGCENAIQKTINEFDGVYSSKADHEKGVAIFEFDSTKVDISKVELAINELGYKAKGHTVLAE